MKKQKPIILQIPKPCSENWAEMKPMALGRFCSHCQKTVTDITKMSDKQIVQLFQQNSYSHCIRAFASQLNRPITFPAQAPTRFYRIALALGLTILSFAAADTYARPRPPLTEQNYLFAEGDTTKKEAISGDTISITGIVLDETGAPFPGVIVKVKSGVFFKGGDVTDYDGSFEINNIAKSDNNYLLFIKDGYWPFEVEYNPQYSNENTPLEIKYNVDKIKIQMGGLREFVEITGDIRTENNQSTKTFNSEDLKKMGY